MNSMTDLTNVWIHEIVRVATNYIKKWHFFCAKKGIIYKKGSVFGSPSEEKLAGFI